MRYLATIILLLIPAAASANMASPGWAGSVGGHISGDVGDLVVDRETLKIDLRPVRDEQPARIVANYVIRNPGPARDLSLQFVAVGITEASDTEVRVDGKAVDFRVDEEALVPQTWTVSPLNTFQSELNPEEMVQGDSIFFEPEIPSGASEIRVAFDAEPWVNRSPEGESPLQQGPDRLNEYSVPYVLEPAKQWKDFGAIDVQIHAPDGWQLATSPSLSDASPARLKGPDEDLETRVLVVYTRPPGIRGWRDGAGLVAGSVLFLMFFPGVAALFPRWRRRNKSSADIDEEGWAFDLVDIGFAAIFALLALPVGLSAFELFALDSHRHPTWMYSLITSVMTIGPILAVLSVFIVKLSRWWSQKASSAA